MYGIRRNSRINKIEKRSYRNIVIVVIGQFYRGGFVFVADVRLCWRSIGVQRWRLRVPSYNLVGSSGRFNEPNSKPLLITIDEEFLRFQIGYR